MPEAPPRAGRWKSLPSFQLAFQYVRGRYGETKDLADVEQSSLPAEIGICGCGAILDKDRVKAQKVGVREGVEYALIQVDATEQQRVQPKISQNGIERRIPETAHAVFRDMDV